MPKAILLQTQAESKKRLHNQNRKLNQIPSWNSLPSCTYSEPSHCHLPEKLMSLLHDCEQASLSVESVSCPVPEFFGFQWIQSLQCFYCETDTCLLFGDHIWKHIARSHNQKFSKIRKYDVLFGFLGHISQCYPKIVSQNTETLKSQLPDSLPQSLPSLPVIQRYKCSREGCTTWSAANESERRKGALNAGHIKHIKSHEGLTKEEYKLGASMKPQWTQILTFGLINGPRSSVVVIVPHDLEPSLEPDKSVFPILTSAATEGAVETWAMELGWEEELKYISGVLHTSMEDTISKLKDLVDLPSQDRVLRAEGNVLKLIEKGLWVLNKLNIQYFSDVIRWIEAKHSSFQRIFGNERFV